ncbi:MAG: 5'-nucleotidase, lipoprotein e(P4) family [Candidatus Electrothrix sp. YB6]
MDKQFVIFLFCLFSFSSVAKAENPPEMFLGVLWAQASAEWNMAAEQAYYLATLNLEKALNDPSWTAALEQQGDFHSLPPAVIVDVDETVLDNSPFAARLVQAGKEYDPKAWENWLRESAAAAIPGAVSFIRSAKEKGIAIFYVTNRELEAATVKNIRTVIDPDVTADQVLCKKERPEWRSDKTSRRSFIAERFRILLLVGDDYNDFTFLGKISPADRINAAKTHRQYWGRKWILLSNPVHGSWKTALYGHDYSLTDHDRLKKKYQLLRTQGVAR